MNLTSLSIPFVFCPHQLPVCTECFDLGVVGKHRIAGVRRVDVHVLACPRDGGVDSSTIQTTLADGDVQNAPIDESVGAKLRVLSVQLSLTSPSQDPPGNLGLMNTETMTSTCNTHLVFTHQCSASGGELGAPLRRRQLSVPISSPSLTQKMM